MSERGKTSALTFDNYPEFLAALQQKQHPFFAVAHRGLWGTVPENSLSAFQQCLDQRIYLIELDLQQTKDGHLIVMHDSTVDRMTSGKGKIAELTMSQIRSLTLKEKNGGRQAKLTDELVPTLREVLSLVKGKAMINADKAWLFREKLYGLLEELDAFDHVLWKSDEPVEKVRNFFHSKKQPLYYMHKVQDSSLNQLDELLSCVSPIAIEILFYSDSDKVVSKPIMQQMRSQANVWSNSLDNAENAGHCDSVSRTDPDKGWGWLADKGFNIIQTDFPLEAQQYMQQRKKDGS
ncbi:glycerophosphodiester phosphodiesterase family protein [Planococcus sp. 1R117A]|uniref:glycerophosphodiester phosphodiesterase family protein n=1 Tax=Planococcus sp. 1R117A TaxID=3447020 RepID=UPI003EDB8AFD